MSGATYGTCYGWPRTIGTVVLHWFGILATIALGVTVAPAIAMLLFVVVQLVLDPGFPKLPVPWWVSLAGWATAVVTYLGVLLPTGSIVWLTRRDHVVLSVDDEAAAG